MIGTRVSHYRITGRLGEGGMGVVYEAVDELLDRPVAMKFPSGQIATSAELENEAKAASRLNHPNVAQVYEFGHLDDGSAFIAMELVRGRTLRDMLKSGPLSLEETKRVIREVAQALEEAHQHGIVHLDIKTGNIALTERGAVKVLDFGLARWRPVDRPNADDDTTKSLLSGWRGTPAYMSPEQAQGFAVDRRSDLFSLGAVFYECLTGRKAFQGTTPESTLVDVASRDPPLPSSIKPGLPPRYDAIVRKLLAKEPQNRYRSAADLISDLEETSSGRTLATAPRRPTWLWPAVAVAAVAVAAWATPWARWFGKTHDLGTVLVLSFENQTGESDRAPFCEGLVEVVTSLLGRSDRFGVARWVIPSADVRKYGIRSVADAGRVFGATTVVNGSVRRGPDEYIVTLNVTDASGPTVIGTRDVRVRDADAGALEELVTRSLLELLNVAALPRSTSAQPPAAGYERFVTGRGYLRQWDKGDNLTKAIEALEASVRANADFAPSQVELSFACFRSFNQTRDQQWLARADQAVRRAIEIDPASIDGQVQLARIQRANGQFDDAIHALDVVLARDPHNLNAMVQLAGALGSAKRGAEAQALYEQALRQQPSYVPARTNLGVLYMVQGQYAKAAEAFELVVKLVPDQVDPHANLGSIYYFLNRLDDAATEFTRSIELNPTAVAYSNRCGLYFYMRALDKSIADCRQAVTIAPKNPIGWGNLADSLVERPATEAEGRAAYRQAMDLGLEQLKANDKDVDLLASMTLYAAKLNQVADARQLAARALSLGSDRVAVLYKVAKSYGLTGDCARALDLLNQAFGKGYSRDDARRDPDLKRFRSGSQVCTVPGM